MADRNEDGKTVRGGLRLDMRVGFRNWELGCGIWDFDSVLDWGSSNLAVLKKRAAGTKVITIVVIDTVYNCVSSKVKSLNEQLSITYGYGGTSGDCRGQIFRVAGATPFWQTFNQRQEEVGGQFYFEDRGYASPKPFFTAETEYHGISSTAVQSSSTFNPSLSPHLQIPKLGCDIYWNNANWWTSGHYTRGGV
ncbi:hypothetical protein D9758_005313 [Tetrapyrgos nigripes]|uniref:Peptidase A1 domain-containing protein n=1 Tax=Tetrapyrgos nigripes TaxID=182062 RepID=A0A8H5LX52_9AGAR|nr:hypothetical protein D9758_005313 [Tetrapyrgos nigripes]